MLKTKRWVSLIVLFGVLLLAGCAGEVSEPTTVSTVPDIFTQPSGTTEPTQSTQTEGTGTTQPIQTDATEPTELQQETGSINTGSLSHGPENVIRDEVTGTHFKYQGGEMHMAYRIAATGTVGQNGIGILLFVDGQLQPYKTLSDDTYRYMHTFYPQEKSEYEEFIFIPVTGQEGDVLEIWYASIDDPNYSLVDGIQGFVLSNGSVTAGTRLKYEATPPAAEYPEITDRITVPVISYVDLTPGETSGWTDTDWQENYEFRMYVNGSDSMYIYNITEEPVTLRFEVWGNPYVHYGLVFFIDNEPVSIAEEDMIFFGVNNGQKTVVEVQLDMTGFDGESVVYAALVPRNWRSAEVLTMNWLDMTRTFFLIAGEPPEDFPG